MISGPANIEPSRPCSALPLEPRGAGGGRRLSRTGAFRKESHRRIFAAMRERLAEGALATLVNFGRFRRSRPARRAAAPAYLARLAASAPSIVNAPDYARQIVDLARRRAIMRVARGALDAAASPAIGGPTQAIAAEAIDGFNEIVAAGAERRRRPLAKRRRSSRARRENQSGNNGLPSGDDRLSRSRHGDRRL